MQTSNSRDLLVERLINSLRVIEVNVQLYDAGEIVAWMPVATELYKLLIDDRYGPLVPELLPNLRLHPLRSQSTSSSVEYLFRAPGVKVEDSRIKFDLFDVDAARIDLPQWLKQDVTEVEGVRPSIADFVTIMRHNISAHFSRKPLGGKAKTIERFAVISELGTARPAFTRVLIDIALYLLAELNAAIDRQPGPRLLLVDQHKLLEIMRDHNEAKALMDEVVYQDAILNQERIGEATRKLENSVGNLLSAELKLWALLIYTHLGEAYRFSYVASKDKRQLFRAIAALENARVLLDESSPSQHRALVLFNLGQIYSAAAAVLGHISCWEVSLSYFQELIGNRSTEEEPELYENAAYQAALLALKLARIPISIRYFQLYWSKRKAGSLG